MRVMVASCCPERTNRNNASIGFEDKREEAEKGGLPYLLGDC